MAQKDLEATRRRQHLLRSGSLHWFHWLVLLASLGLTVGAWSYSKQQHEERVEAQFERESSRVAELLVERMQKYEDALWGGVGAYQAQSGQLDHKSFQRFAETLQIDVKYPGINGIGVIQRVAREELVAHSDAQRLERPYYRVHPKHGGPELLPIVFIEPEAPNRKAVGLDVAHEQNRYTSAKRARDTGTAQMTAPIVLVQDSQKTPGFLLYAPYYKRGPLDTVSERIVRFAGMVYAPFVMKKLMEGTLSVRGRHVGIRVSDGGSVLYDENEPSDPGYDPDPLFQATKIVQLYGRTWEFSVQSNRSFRKAAHNTQPVTILIGGILIDALLFVLFLVLSRASRQAVQFADLANRDLQLRTEELERSNVDLQQFAYAASHDLKAPLRAISSLVDWIREDLGKPGAREDVDRNLELLKGRAKRLSNLVAGILSYSQIDAPTELARKKVSVATLVEQICQDYSDIQGMVVEVEGTLPILQTNAHLLEQVLSNLIGNAIKHHHCAKGKVTIRSKASGDDHVQISVCDDGPGIDPVYHERIFGIFQTLKPRDELESTGIGLSLVRKIVTSVGGKVWVESNANRGVTFTFSWPSGEKGADMSVEEAA